MQAQDWQRRLVVAMGGASGAIYGIRFLRQAVRFYDEIYLTLSANVPSVVEAELGIHLSNPPTVAELIGRDAPQIRIVNSHDYFTPPASARFVMRVWSSFRVRWEPRVVLLPGFPTT